MFETLKSVLHLKLIVMATIACGLHYHYGFIGEETEAPWKLKGC
jgi:hypothetical protein